MLDHLRGLVEKQVRDHGIVVWYDPERAYGEAVAQLGLAETPRSADARERDVDGLQIEGCRVDVPTCPLPHRVVLGVVRVR